MKDDFKSNHIFGVVMQESSKRFYDLLREKSPDLADQLDLIKDRGMETWLPMLPFDRGSHSGYPHIRNVERNVDKIVPDDVKEKFSVGEMFLLLCAVFLHDIGKIVPSYKHCPIDGELIENTICKFNSKDYEAADIHHKQSCDIIRQAWGMLGFSDERISEYCAVLAYCHCLKKQPTEEDLKYIGRSYKNTSLEPYGYLRIPLLVEILRLADETDNSWMRSVSKYFYERIDTQSYSSLIKAFRRWIEDVEFCHQGKCVILHINIIGDDKTRIDDQIDALNRCRHEIQNILKVWSNRLKDEQIEYSYVLFEYQGKLYSKLEIEKGKLKKQNFIDIFINEIPDNTKKGNVHENRKIGIRADRNKKKLKESLKRLLAQLGLWRNAVKDMPDNLFNVFLEYQGEHINLLDSEGTITDVKKIDEIFDRKLDTNDLESNPKRAKDNIINTIEKLVDEIIKLSLGSMGYKKFRWCSLEKEVGRNLTAQDAWIVECLESATDGMLKVNFIPGETGYISVNFDPCKVCSEKKSCNNCEKKNRLLNKLGIKKEGSK